MHFPLSIQITVIRYGDQRDYHKYNIYSIYRLRHLPENYWSCGSNKREYNDITREQT